MQLLHENVSVSHIKPEVCTKTTELGQSQFLEFSCQLYCVAVPTQLVLFFDYYQNKQVLLGCLPSKKETGAWISYPQRKKQHWSPSSVIWQSNSLAFFLVFLLSLNLELLCDQYPKGKTDINGKERLCPDPGTSIALFFGTLSWQGWQGCSHKEEMQAYRRGAPGFKINHFFIHYMLSIEKS